MKKIFIIFICLVFFFIGLTISDPTISQSKLIKNDIDKFEEKILVKGNDFKSTDLVPKDNVINKIAHKIDRLIEKLQKTLK